MYQTAPYNSIKFYRVSDKETLIKFHFKPNVTVAHKYVNEDKSIALIEVSYYLYCDFEDKKKPLKIFASAIQQFTVIKNDTLDIDIKNEGIYNCVKEIDHKFQEYLYKRSPAMTLRTIGLKPITFESWKRGSHRNDIEFSAN